MKSYTFTEKELEDALREYFRDNFRHNASSDAADLKDFLYVVALKNGKITEE